MNLDRKQSFCLVSNLTSKPDHNIQEAIYQGQVPKAFSKPVYLQMFTDPICSTCWVAEGSLRRLLVEFGDLIDFFPIMGGLLPSWDGFSRGGICGPEDVYLHWEEISKDFQVPIDGRVWLEDPLYSSMPACKAYYAVRLQAPHKAMAFLRLMKEMVFINRHNISKLQHLIDCVEIMGLDVGRFKRDMESNTDHVMNENAILMRKYDVKVFPTFIISNPMGQVIKLEGFSNDDLLEEAVLSLIDENVSSQRDPLVDPFDFYESFSTKEYATFKRISVQEALEELESREEKSQLFRSEIPQGDMWYSY